LSPVIWIILVLVILVIVALVVFQQKRRAGGVIAGTKPTQPTKGSTTDE